MSLFYTNHVTNLHHDYSENGEETSSESSGSMSSRRKGKVRADCLLQSDGDKDPEGLERL